jgi:hypothetical protein
LITKHFIKNIFFGSLGFDKMAAKFKMASETYIFYSPIFHRFQ